MCVFTCVHVIERKQVVYDSVVVFQTFISNFYILLALLLKG